MVGDVVWIDRRCGGNRGGRQGTVAGGVGPAGASSAVAGFGAGAGLGVTGGVPDASGAAAFSFSPLKA